MSITTVTDRASGTVQIYLSERTRQAFCRALLRSYIDILTTLGIELPFIPKRATLAQKCDKLKPLAIVALDERKSPALADPYWQRMEGENFIHLLVGAYSFEGPESGRGYLRTWIGIQLPVDKGDAWSPVAKTGPAEP